MSDDSEMRDWLHSNGPGNYDRIRDSKMFLTLFNQDMRKEALPCLQLGLAIMMDKPILILAPREAVIPTNLKRIAVAIERFDSDDIENTKTAMDRLMKKAKDLGL